MTIFRCKAQIMNMDYLKLAELGFNFLTFILLIILVNYLSRES